MLTPDSHDHEWFQATVTFGNFDSKQDADNFTKHFKDKYDSFVSAETIGSWH